MIICSQTAEKGEILVEEKRQSAKWLVSCSLFTLAAGAALEFFYYPLRQGMESGAFWWMTGILSILFFLLASGVLAGCSLAAVRALFPGKMEETIRKILGALLLFVLWLLISSHPVGLAVGGAAFAAALIVKKKWGALAALVCAAVCLFLITDNRGARLSQELRFRMEAGKFQAAAEAVEKGTLPVVTVNGESVVRLEGEYAGLSRDSVVGASYAGVRKDGDSIVLLFFWYHKDYEYRAFAYVYQGDGGYTQLSKRNFESEDLGNGWYLYNTLVDDD